MKIDGACHCGAITYQAELDLAKVGICHCADCQALSASAFRTIAIAPSEGFKILEGTPKHYVKVGDSGNPRVQAFCSDCGSGLYSCGTEEKPEAYNLRVGTIRQRGLLVPKFECWTQSRLEWMAKTNGTATFDKNPAV
ncbi:GFA family protein [Shimia sp.]|uniref:GFA family protein n=1 Tax=Shimia sp. TaxID=1954381 RepID=UPI00329716BC